MTAVASAGSTSMSPSCVAATLIDGTGSRYLHAPRRARTGTGPRIPPGCLHSVPPRGGYHVSHPPVRGAPPIASSGSIEGGRMPAVGQNVTEIEREIRMIRDPERRAIRAVEAHREARELATRLSILRRDAFLALHDTGRTWQEVADSVGMSLKAIVKAAHGTGDPGRWWKRLPADVVESVKRGPGGRVTTNLIPRQTLMDAIVEILAEAEHANRDLGRGGARMSPGDLAQRSADHLGKPVSMPSLRNALYTLIEEGRVARVGHGRYVLTQEPPVAKARAAKKVRTTKTATKD